MKEFSCRQECDGNCCEFVVINTLTTADDIMDKQYFDLRNIEFTEEKLNDKLNRVIFKIPIVCKWLIGNKCKNYNDRPLTCRILGGGVEGRPYSISGCPYIRKINNGND